MRRRLLGRNSQQNIIRSSILLRIPQDPNGIEIIRTFMLGVSEIDEMLISGLVLIGQNENSIIAIMALLATQRQRWWMVDWIGKNLERDYYPETIEVWRRAGYFRRLEKKLLQIKGINGITKT